MPALSLKFLDDLSLAYAWLWANGCSLETPAEYVSMLKYNGPEQFPGKRYPPPLVALQIPEDALEDEVVDELALAFFNEARAFILAHELGHIYYGHPGYGPDIPRATARRNEAEADQFALEALRGSATIPVGVLTFFFSYAHYVPTRWDFAEEAEWNEYLEETTHPLTSARLYALAATMEENVDSFALGQPDPASARDTILYIAANIAGIAQHLDDSEVQEAITLAAAETTVQDLAPRCPEATSTGTLPALPAFDGVYSGDFVVVGEGLEDVLPVEITLQRNNDRVNGRFNFGLGAGSLDGMVVEDRLYFNWQWGWTYGKGVFYASQDGNSFEGSWGLELSEDNGGRWSGHRIGE
jgi:hypothetical protein